VSLCLLGFSASHAANLVLTSEPVGAAVTLDGEAQGQTPLTVPVPDTAIGSVEVRFELPGYVPSIVEIGLAPQRDVVVKAVLVPLSDLTAGNSGHDASSGAPLVSPAAYADAETRAITEALGRFRTDCRAYPASLDDLAVRSADDLSARVNAAGERLVGEGFRGPYLAAIPVDPVTGAADWYYDSATGEVCSQLARPALATVTLRPAATAQAVSLEEWLRLFARATGVTCGRVPEEIERPVGGGTITPPQPGGSVWRSVE